VIEQYLVGLYVRSFQVMTHEHRAVWQWWADNPAELLQCYLVIFK